MMAFFEQQPEWLKREKALKVPHVIPSTICKDLAGKMFNRNILS
jgi:hypothetical protein